MWTEITRPKYERAGRRYASDLTDAEWRVISRRWVIERTFAWLNRNRRLPNDFETSITCTTTWIYIPSTQLLIRRLADA